MDKAIILGVFNFVSFHLCKSLLTRGTEVTGIHIEDESNVNLVDEKRLEIGRNANFVEQFLTDLERETEQVEIDTAIVVSLFDIYMLKAEPILQKQETLQFILDLINHQKEKMKLILLLPIQMLTTSLQGEAEKTLKGFIDELNPDSQKTQFIYLPSVYGPWQESTFLFQQAIQSKFTNADLIIEEREWREDTLYIQDAIDEIVELMDGRQYGSYLLKSGKDKHWFSCAAYLNIDEKLIKKARTSQKQLAMESRIIETTVKKVTSIPKSFTEQMGLIQRLNESEAWESEH